MATDLAAGQGRLGRLHLGNATSAGVRPKWCSTPWCSNTTIAQLKKPLPCTGKELACVMIEPIAEHGSARASACPHERCPRAVYRIRARCWRSMEP